MLQMHQLTQKLKGGAMRVLETPAPALNLGQILVKNIYSLISAGTEDSTVKAAHKGYIGKAKIRPQQVKQIIDTLITQGPTQIGWVGRDFWCLAICRRFFVKTSIHLLGSHLSLNFILQLSILWPEG